MYLYIFLNQVKPMYIKREKSLGNMVLIDSLADSAERKIHPPQILIFWLPDSKTTSWYRRKWPHAWHYQLLQAFLPPACLSLELGNSFLANGDCCFFTSKQHQHDTDIFYCYLTLLKLPFSKVHIFSCFYYKWATSLEILNRKNH